MKKWLKWGLIGVGGLVTLVASGGGIFVWTQVSAFEESMGKVYDIPPADLKVQATPENLERGKHLAMSIAGCAMGDCHGADLAGGKKIEIGPLGTFTGPNITTGGLGAAYSDGELARLISHGVTKSGKSLRFMPAHEVSWLPQPDIEAVIAYIRSMPASDKPNGPMELGLLAKILDRQDAIVIDVARRINHEKRETVPAPEPTEKYGKFIGRLCTGCHGATLGGGPIPGAPPDLPIPPNITPHASGLGADYTFADFEKLLDQQLKKDGEKLDPFMPAEALANMDAIERKALFEFLRSLPPKEFGSR